MEIAVILPRYIIWHYTVALFRIYAIWTNIVWFSWRFFSITELTKTIFAPWRRLGEETEGGDIETKLSGWTVNFLMRIIGFFIRLIVFIFGLIVTFIAILGIIPMYFLWLVSPVAIFVLFFRGLMLMLA